MKIINKNINDLKEYENNPRHNDNAGYPVMKSIKEFGFKVPIIIDKNNVIVAGHTRLKAAHKLGLETVPCVVADDLSEEKIKAFRIADNVTSDLAEWDFELLEKELAEISNIDMSAFGFDDNLLENFNDDIPHEIELPRDEQGVASQLPSIKFGTKTINLTEDEKMRFESFYNNYMNENGSAFGLVLELLNNGDCNYAS